MTGTPTYLQEPLWWLLFNLIVSFGLWWGYPRIASHYRHLVLRARWIGIPYLSLMLGSVSPRLMGLTGINWLASFGFGMGMIGVVLALLTVVRSTTDSYANALSLPTISAHLDSAPLDEVNRRGSRVSVFTPVSLLDLGAEEFHWAFLRGALWELFLAIPAWAAQAGYWAVWGAALLAIPDILRYQPTLPYRLFKCALLFVTSVLFLYTRNFWLCWLLHSLGWLLLTPATLARNTNTVKQSQPEPRA
ncbi:MAG: hypothetical protein R3C14_11355 [Caldilineaceae bacterium]